MQSPGMSLDLPQTSPRPPLDGCRKPTNDGPDLPQMFALSWEDIPLGAAVSARGRLGAGARATLDHGKHPSNPGGAWRFGRRWSDRASGWLDLRFLQGVAVLLRVRMGGD